MKCQQHSHWPDMTPDASFHHRNTALTCKNTHTVNTCRQRRTPSRPPVPTGLLDAVARGLCLAFNEGQRPSPRKIDRLCGRGEPTGFVRRVRRMISRFGAAKKRTMRAMHDASVSAGMDINRNSASYRP